MFMSTEHVVSGLAALRDTIALPELFGMVIESLGGQAALADALGNQVESEAAKGEQDRPRDAAGLDLDAMRDSDVARMQNIQGMAETFCTWLHAKGEQQMKRDDDAAADRLRQLSGSFSKAARAVRLSMVLKHEVAGLRPLPQARAGNQAGAANQNNAANRGGNRSGNHEPVGRAFSSDPVDWTEDERDDAEDEFGLEMLALLDAFDKDVATASPEIQEEVKQQSVAVILTKVAASIPHPHLDRRIAEIRLSELWDAMAPVNATKPDALAAPDWESVRRDLWNDDDHREARAAREARRRQ
jgi:hypothetical protein